MPSAATTSIGYGKSLPVIAFSWGPKDLNTYSGNPLDQYTYLWVAVLKPDRSGVELYQAIDSGGQPWRAGTATTGAGYSLVQSISLSNPTREQIRWIGLSFSPSGRARVGLLYENTSPENPYGILKIAALKGSELVFANRGVIFFGESNKRTTGFAMLNTVQVHGRLSRALTVAICGLYDSSEQGTRLVTMASPIDTLDASFVSYGIAQHIEATVKQQTPVTVAGYLIGEHYVVPANPVANPNTAHLPGGNGQLFLYSPQSGQTLTLAIKPLARQGITTAPATIGQGETPLSASGLTIGQLGEVEIGELNYGQQGEGLKIYAYMS